MAYNSHPSHSISLLVENRPGALVRIALVFSRRGYNIDSLVVSPAQDERFARMNIVARGNPDILGQIIKQLVKLVDVLNATDHTDDSVVEKELALIKMKCPTEHRTELLQVIQHFKAMTIDMTPESAIVQVTGDSEKIDAMKELCEKFNIVEYIRTGKVIMARGGEET